MRWWHDKHKRHRYNKTVIRHKGGKERSNKTKVQKPRGRSKQRRNRHTDYSRCSSRTKLDRWEEEATEEDQKRLTYKKTTGTKNEVEENTETGVQSEAGRQEEADAQTTNRGITNKAQREKLDIQTSLSTGRQALTKHSPGELRNSLKLLKDCDTASLAIVLSTSPASDLDTHTDTQRQNERKVLESPIYSHNATHDIWINGHVISNIF